jgi:spore maturation protein SpmA
MLNGIFVFVVLVSILLAAASGHMKELTDAILQESRRAVDIAIKLIGVMAFFLGLMKVAEDGGLLRLLSRAVAPVMRRLFPSVPPEHPAMSAMIMNIGANMLGLANAATPFGIRAIEELDTLNGRKGTATNAMVLFLAINTAGLAILPSGVIGLRAAAGSADATGIFFPTWFASGCATLTGVIVAIWLSRLRRYRATEPPGAAPREPAAGAERADDDPFEGAPVGEVISWRRVALWLFWLVFLGLLIHHVARSIGGRPVHELTKEVLSHWMLPAIVLGMVLFGWSRGVKVYESLVEGAKQGFQVAVRIIPFLVAIVVAVGMFRASGGMDLIVGWLSPLTTLIGMPAEALPMAILRPMTGSGALGYMVETMSTHGPDTLLGYLVSTYQGSTETTFYVLAVYYGAVGVKRTRHTLPACLAADTAGILAATFIVNVMFG